MSQHTERELLDELVTVVGSLAKAVEGLTHAVTVGAFLRDGSGVDAWEHEDTPPEAPEPSPGLLVQAKEPCEKCGSLAVHFAENGCYCANCGKLVHAAG